MSARDFDPAQLRRGTLVELEHTDSRRAARRIAMDHLAEDRRYYTKLAKVHREAPGPKLCRSCASRRRRKRTRRSR